MVQRLQNPARTVWLILMLTALVGSLASFVYALKAFKNDLPPVSLTPETLDLGTFPQGEERSGTVIVRNNSSEQVVVHKIVLSCGCADADISSRSLAPGAETTLHVTLRAGEARGRVHLTLYLVYSLGEGANKYHEVLPLIANIDPDYDVVPDVLTFSARDTDLHRLVTLTPKLIGSVEIVSVSTTRRAFTAKIVSFSPTQTTVEVVFDPLKYESTGGGVFVNLATNSKKQPVFRLPLVVRKEGRIE
jgi:hypothetical protein